MKKLLLLLLLILIGCSEEPINGKLLEYSSKGYYHKSTGEIYTGPVYELWDDWTSHGSGWDEVGFEEGYIKNGKRHGTFTSRFVLWDGDTPRKKERDFKNGELEMVRVYHHNGKLSFEEPYKNRRKHGTQKFYDTETGQLKSGYIYKNGKLESEINY
mgnify:CR=1 FL=1